MEINRAPVKDYGDEGVAQAVYGDVGVLAQRHSNPCQTFFNLEGSSCPSGLKHQVSCGVYTYTSHPINREGGYNLPNGGFPAMAFYCLVMRLAGQKLSLCFFISRS